LGECGRTEFINSSGCSDLQETEWRNCGNVELAVVGRRPSSSPDSANPPIRPADFPLGSRPLRGFERGHVVRQRRQRAPKDAQRVWRCFRVECRTLVRGWKVPYRRNHADGRTVCAPHLHEHGAVSVAESNRAGKLTTPSQQREDSYYGCPPVRRLVGTPTLRAS
jgi:hypothetical protein